MKITISVLLALGLIALAFGLWGANTAAGRLRYSGFDGIIPYAGSVAGIILIFVALILVVIRAGKRHARDK